MERRQGMSCYFRHMKDILEEIGVEVTKKNKKDIDRVIHDLVDVEYKNCSDAWKTVKAQIKGDDASRARFVEQLKSSLKDL
jgi:hypothetical protein